MDKADTAGRADVRPVSAEISAEQSAGAWASLMLRLTIASLFVAAVVPKWMQGLGAPRALADTFVKTFENGWLPIALVRPMGYLNPLIETLIPIWLVLGIWLRAAWVFTTLFLISLAFGMASLGKHDVAANNYTYVLIACVGLYMSRYDRFSLRPFARE